MIAYTCERHSEILEENEFIKAKRIVSRRRFIWQITFVDLAEES